MCFFVILFSATAKSNARNKRKQLSALAKMGTLRKRDKLYRPNSQMAGFHRRDNRPNATCCQTGGAFVAHRYKGTQPIAKHSFAQRFAAVCALTSLVPLRFEAAGLTVDVYV
jgi:hypothetical protein